jgi:hypothetical protein
VRAIRLTKCQCKIGEISSNGAAPSKSQAETLNQIHESDLRCVAFSEAVECNGAAETVNRSLTVRVV